nr:efflux (PET) family inner membrane protein YccS [Raoultella sp. NCTC 9187]
MLSPCYAVIHGTAPGSITPGFSSPLCGTTAVPWWLGEVKLTIPLTLGVVAAALTDLDDRLTGRLRNLAITLVCFFIASASVELLFPWPWLFALGLTLSTTGFILLGGLGQRYATIAFGALLIAIYTMLGVTLYDRWYLQPLFLLTGAVWYNLLTLAGHIIFPIRPLQDNLARSYELLARYLDLKSRMFDPDIEDESQAPLYDLAIANGQLVATLNQTKTSLLTRLRGDRGQRGTRRTLQYYFVAQDIHERASSSHIQYQTLRDRFSLQRHHVPLSAHAIDAGSGVSEVIPRYFAARTLPARCAFRARIYAS